MATSIKDLEYKLETLTNVVMSLATSVDTFNKTGNRKLDQALKVKTDLINIEQGIKDALMESMVKSISSVLTYNKTSFEPFIISCLEVNKQLIKDSINIALQQEFAETNLVPIVREHFRSKLVKTLLSGTESVVDKSLQELRKDPVFNAQLVLMVSNLVKEYSKE